MPPGIGYPQQLPDNSPDYDELLALYNQATVPVAESPVPDVALNQPAPVYSVDDLIRESQGLPSEPALVQAGTPLSAAPTVTKKKTDREVATSTSERGFSPFQLQKTEGLYNKTDKRIAQRQNDLTRQAAQESGMVSDFVGEQKELVGREGQLNQEVAEERRLLAEEQAKLLTDNRINEQASLQKAELAADSAMQDYKRASAEYSAMNVNPGGLWQDASQGQKLGMLMGAFTQGFLGAEGIDTGFMKSFDRAVDQHIDAQVKAIEQKGKVVGQFAQVYDMVRANSQTEAEARTKMRGLMLDEFKQASVAKLASYDSKFAGITAEKAAAELDGKILENDLALRKTLRDDHKTVIDQENQRAYQQGSLAIQSKTNSLRERELLATEEANKNAAKAKQVQEEAKSVVRDPYTNEVMGVANNEKTHDDAQKAVNAAASLEEKIARLEELVREEGAVLNLPGAKKVLASKTRTELESLYNEIGLERRKLLSGLAGSDKELQKVEDIMPMDTFLTGVLSNDKPGIWVASRLSLRTMEDTKREIGTRLRAASPEVIEFARGVNTDPYEKSGRKDRQKTATDTKQTTPATALKGEAEGYDKFRAVGRNVSGSPGGAVAPQTLVDEYTAAGLNPSGRLDPEAVERLGVSDIPQWFDAMDKQSEIVKDLNQSEAARQEALDYIWDTLEENTREGSAPWEKDEALAANYFLDQLAKEGRTKDGKLVHKD